ncbi:ribosomal protein S18-alanine N-acetyltransferase [Aeropyrum camini]|uniref:N-terminal acetyltransferase n=1 Tax=Aeropyrum camini SY1 = JCM 12091 TaxID=1198449 RepID=U3TE40_9CREN|nr:ribosomal protein S18-alanine N-acetyltransferase [Aeropyrum camini]BAN90691.1 N-terminal acetyltransferase [Aeropyrum camini SY1 = JCM 12091]
MNREAQESQGDVRIRKARAQDIPVVMEINLESLPENYWYGFYKYILDNWGEAFLVAEIRGEIVGYAMSRVEHTSDPVLLGMKDELEGDKSVIEKILDAIRNQLSEERPVGHLVSIAVRPKFRGRGIGSMLLSETIYVMENVYKVDAIFLEVRVSNTPAIRLYEKFGFRKVRRIRGYYRDGEDAFVMVKRLI